MCKIMEEMRNEAAREAELKTARETAERLIKKGKLPVAVFVDGEIKKLKLEIRKIQGAFW